MSACAPQPDPQPDSCPDSFTLYLGEAEIRVRSELPDVAGGLWAVWRSASEPVIAPQRVHTLSVRHRGAQVEVWLDQTCQARVDPADALPVAEKVLYESVEPWFGSRLALLHAALVAGSEACALLVGHSGAGKSSLSLRGLQRGYAYGGDELAFSDGERVWGAPRAVLFDPTWVGNGLPEVAASADRERYRFENALGVPCFLPICQPPTEQVLRAPWPLSRTHVVLLEQGETTHLQSADRLEVLAALHRECRGQVQLVAAQLHPESCHHLRWNTLDSAWDNLGRLLGGPARPGPLDPGTAA